MCAHIIRGRIRILLSTLYHVVRFEGSVYGDKLVEICGNILRATKFQRAATFRGNMVITIAPMKI